MKKILISLTILATSAAIISGITIAYFSDTETSENNTFATGTMDLDIYGGDAPVTTMTLLNKAPGDSGAEIGTTLKNSGSLAGELDVAVGAVTNYPCTDTTYGKHDGTEYCTSNAGSLGANAEMALYIDIDKNDAYDNGTDIGLKSDGTIYASGALDYDAIDNYSGKIWDPSNNGVVTIATGVEYNFVIDWQIPTSAGNEIQGDALDFDVTFVLEQANND